MVYKFRSMSVCENGDTVIQARANDNRVTPLAPSQPHLAGRTAPVHQCAAGRMSVVGPAHAVAHNETYRKLVRGCMIRLRSAPASPAGAERLPRRN